MAMAAFDDSTGVSQLVIDYVKYWRDWLFNNEKEDLTEDPGRIVSLSTSYRVSNRREAEYIIQCLRMVLPLGSIRRNALKKPVQLGLDGSSRMPDEAVDVFCDFLLQPQQPNTSFLALTLGRMPPRQFRRVLESLRVNTSVNELTFFALQEEDVALCCTEVLLHKTDIITLRLWSCSFRIADIRLLLRREMTHLQTLAVADFDIGDEDLPFLLETIGGAFPMLKDFDFRGNNITPVGLRSLSERGRVVLRRLQQLDLTSNRHLLDDLESTRLFVQNMLLPDEMSLKGLRIGCGKHLPVIIAACENDKCKLQKLHIHSRGHSWCQSSCDQIISSMPKMKTMENLHYTGLFYNIPAITAALHHNTSIVKITTESLGTRYSPPVAAPFLHRNLHLKHADSLLALQPNTQIPIGSKSGVWPMAFAKMGEMAYFEPDSDEDEEEEDDDNEEEKDDEDKQDGIGRSATRRELYTGASAIFKILHKRPAIFEVQLRRPTDISSGGKKRALETDVVASGQKCQRL